MTETQRKTSTKKRVLTETRVIVEPGWNPSRTPDENKRFMERWASDLMAFFRDHRSMDVNAVYAEPTYMDVCSACHNEYEEATDDETGEQFCASCGATIEPTEHVRGNE